MKHSMPESEPLKRESDVVTPHRGGYINTQVIMWGSVIGLVTTVISSVTWYLHYTDEVRSNEMWWILLITLTLGSVICGSRYIARRVSYSKTRYTIYADRIVSETGGLLSDQKSELIYSNVTRVSLILPYIEHKLYKTGHVKIESAGARDAEIEMRSVKHPEKLYQKTIADLQGQGISLTRSELVQSERPHSVAVFFATVQAGMYALLIIAYGLSMGDQYPLWNWLMDHPQSLTLFGVLTLVFIGIYSRFTYLDMSRRIYHLFNDCVEYHEGFLTKVSTMIPLENLSDSSVNQSLFGKLFDFSDVKLSCQGSLQEISFSNITNGDELSINLDHQLKRVRDHAQEVKSRRDHSAQVSDLHKSSIQVGSTEESWSGDQSASSSAQPASNDESRHDQTSYDQTSTLELRMDKLKGILPIVALILLAMGVVIGGHLLGLDELLYDVHIPMSIVILLITVPSLLLKMLCTTYQVKPLSVERTFSFMSRVTTEFSFDKVTAITFKRSPLDRLVNTCSVHFWSIGSGETLVLSGVRIDEETEHTLMRKCGIEPSSESRHQLKADHSLISIFSANLKSCLFWIALVVGVSYLLFYADQGSVISDPLISTDQLIYIVYGSIAAVVALSFLVSHLYHRTLELSLYQRHVGFTHGLINQYERYALYSDIKDVEIVTYPLMNHGSLQLNIAGEQNPYHPQNQRVNVGAIARFNAYSFKLTHLADAQATGALVDELLMMSGAPSTEAISALMSDPPRHSERITARSSLKNPLLVHIMAFGGGSAMVANSMQAELSPLAYTAFGVVFMLSTLMIIISMRCRTYSVQDRRVIAREGVLYKRQISIIFDRIDSISAKQQLLHKLCGNSDIMINTTGSSAPEITIKNISNHQELYHLLKESYQAK